MKTRYAKLVRLCSSLALAILAASSRAPAQTPPALDLQVYAGLAITGRVGTVYSVEYLTDLAQTGPWRCLAFLQLPSTHHLWFDPSAPATGSRFYRAAESAVPTNMVFIRPGTFRMGSPEDEVGRNIVDAEVGEGPQTAVTISRGFWMGKHEVTQAEYLELIGTNPSGFKGDANRPVDTVSWIDATNYCGRLTQRERAAGRIPINSLYRLPTEAEWEYACRAWTSTRYSHGDDPAYAASADYAWYDANSGAMTHPVGQKLPNPWGLHDMHGNVAEWCQDWYKAYPGGIALDPQGPATGSARAVRGGLWYRPATYCRSAFRIGFAVGAKTDGIGFRVVLAANQP